MERGETPSQVNVGSISEMLIFLMEERLKQDRDC